MIDRIGSGFVSWALISACLVTLACGSATPEPPEEGEPDEGTEVPAPGPDSEQASVCAVPAPTSCPTPAPRYADVEPIFTNRCTVCHAGNPGGPWSLKGYSHVSDWQDTIRTQVRDCTMPPPEANSAITVQERAAILTWIRCGLPR
jgi:uncharacterized membrane protein